MSDKVRKENSKQSEDQANDEDDPGMEESSGDIKPVNVRFAKSGGDSEKFKKAREKSYEFQQQKARWIWKHIFDHFHGQWIWPDHMKLVHSWYTKIYAQKQWQS